MATILGGHVTPRSVLGSVSVALAFVFLPALSGPALAGPMSGTTSGYIVQLRPTAGIVPTLAGHQLATPAAAADTTRATDQAVNRLGSDFGFRASMTYSRALIGFAAELTAAQVAALRRDPRVAVVTPDLPVAPADQVLSTGVRRVYADTSPLAVDPVDIDVATIDSGVSMLRTDDLCLPNSPSSSDCPTHGKGRSCVPDDVVNGTPDQIDPKDWDDKLSDGHGTHVAGILAAEDNATGVLGVAPGARIWPVRVFPANGSGKTSYIVCAIDWLLTKTKPVDPNHPHGAQEPIVSVVNMSLEGSGTNHPCSISPATPSGDPEHDAICTAVAAGMTFVVAAGNHATDAALTSPADYPEVITVSALTDTDGLPGGHGTSCSGADDSFATYSNFGPAVDLIAPGSCIVSLNRAAGSTESLSGTSMSAPLVAGAAALYLTTHPGASPSTVADALRAAGTLDWTTTTDPDGQPDRLLDVSRLSGPDGIDLWVSPNSWAVGAGVAQPTFAVDLGRRADFAGSTTLSVVNLPTGVQAAFVQPTLSTLSDIHTLLTLTIASDAPSVDIVLDVHASASPLDADAYIELTIDHDPPLVDGPHVGFVAGATLGSFSVPLAVDWSATDTASGVDQYVLRQQIDGGSWQGVTLPSDLATSAVRQVQFSHRYEYEVDATDGAGNTAVSQSTTMTPSRHESNYRKVTTTGSWATKTATTASGGSYRRSKTAGATMSLTFTGRSIAWVAPVGPNLGSAHVFIDGTDQGDVSLVAASNGVQRLVYVTSWDAPGTHTIRIVVDAGSPAKWVGVDAFLVLKG